MRCVYYATGNMVGVQKLYEAVRSVDIDKDKKRLEVGDYVKIIGDDSSVVAIVEERLENIGYVVKRRSLGKKLKTQYRRDEVRLVHGITRDMVKDFLMRQKVYQLSRRPKRTKRNARAFVPNGRRSVIQIDLIGPMTKEGVCDKRHALVAIDVFTRKAFTRALKSTSARPAGRRLSRCWRR